jgi:hypothetical protein
MFFEKSRKRRACSLINDNFIICLTLTIIVACTFLAELEVQEKTYLVHYMRTRDMEDA